MRRLRSARARADRGATTVVVALLFTGLVGAVGIGVDTSSMAFQRSRAQNSADAAAVAIAQDCGLRKSTCTSSGAMSTATYFANENSAGGTVSVPGGVTPTSGSVRVRVEKTVPTTLLSFVGVDSRTVTAEAKATWGGHPAQGSPVLPMGVPYCMYAANMAPATTPILLRSDLVSVVFNVIVQGGVAGRIITTLLSDLLSVTQSCTSPDGLNLQMLRGPIWLSGLEGAVNGVLNWNSSICNMHLGTITGFLGSTISAVIPSNCMNKLGTSIKRGQVVLMPVYQPSITLQQLGLEMDACLLGICSAKVPPRIGVKVLGFVPFKITGWNFPTNAQPDPNAPACMAINLLTHPPASVGCHGIQGYFVSSMTKDPDFTYSPTGADFGAGAVELAD